MQLAALPSAVSNSTALCPAVYTAGQKAVFIVCTLLGQRVPFIQYITLGDPRAEKAQAPLRSFPSFRDTPSPGRTPRPTPKPFGLPGCPHCVAWRNFCQQPRRQKRKSPAHPPLGRVFRAKKICIYYTLCVDFNY